MAMITVTVPIYNKEEYLHRSIPALLSQTYGDYEILLVDDGSTDRSPEICDWYAAQNPGVKVFHKENGGLSSARNCGIENARGEYIIFPDPDDLTSPGYLETLMELHEEHRTDLEIAGHYIIKGGKEILWNKNGRNAVMNTEEALSMLMRWDSFNGYTWNKLFHMDIIRKNRLRFDEELGTIQDLHFCFRYICLCSSVVYDPGPVYYYDMAAGVSSPFTPLTERKMSGLAAYEKIADLAREDYPAMEAAAYSLLYNICMSYMYAYYYSGMDEPEKLALLRRNLRKYRTCFFADKAHSIPHKLLGITALASPKTYYRCSRIVRKLPRRRERT